METNLKFTVRSVPFDNVNDVLENTEDMGDLKCNSVQLLELTYLEGKYELFNTKLIILGCA